MNASIPVLLLLSALVSAASSPEDVGEERPATTQPKPFPAGPADDDDYRRIDGFGDYKVSYDGATWEAAFQACSEDGGYLLVLGSQQEFDALYDTYWIPTFSWYGARPNGATENGTKQFVTIFGEPLEESGYNEWAWDPDSDEFSDPAFNSVLLNLGVAGPLGVGLQLNKDDEELYTCKKDI